MQFTTMLNYKANEYITLKLENKYTQIYVKNRKFTQYIRLVLNIPTDQFKDYDQINSIDETADVYKRKTIHKNEIIHEAGARNVNLAHDITPEQEFWGIVPTSRLGLNINMILDYFIQIYHSPS